jgi:hypothetical protein
MQVTGLSALGHARANQFAYLHVPDRMSDVQSPCFTSLCVSCLTSLDGKNASVSSHSLTLY